MNILIIGSNTLDHSLVDDIISEQRQKVEVTATGQEALDLLNQQEFDLVLVNLFLPDARGQDLIPEIKKRMLAPNIITVTEKNTRELESSVREQGVSYYLIKPVETKHLGDIINHLFGRSLC